jgi:AcrR family transcriptional regulator
MTQRSRGERQRDELVAEILDEARRQLEAGGPNGISLRAVARAVGMSAPSLYTYFPSLAHIYTELITQSYGDLAATIERALARHSKSDPHERLLIGPRAYRRWALAHREQFNLIFFDQIRGYKAPPEGPTVDAQTMALRPIAATYAAVVGFDLDELTTDGGLLDDFIGWWGAFHGLVALEVNHHLDWRNPSQIFERHLATSTGHLLDQHRPTPPQPAPNRGDTR